MDSFMLLGHLFIKVFYKTQKAFKFILTVAHHLKRYIPKYLSFVADANFTFKSISVSKVY